MAISFKRPSDHLPSAKGLLLFLLPLPVLIAALLALGKSNFFGFIANAGGYALYLAGALLVRRGLRNAQDYERRKIAHAPYPFKTLGAGLVAAATGCTAFLAAGYSLPIAACFGLGALLGCYLVYGFDPRAEKQATDAYGMDTTVQVVQALDSAERTIAAIDQAKREIRNPELSARLKRIIELAQQITSVIEENPQDFRRARKFLNVYLEGAQQVTAGYARTHQRAQSQELEDNFRRVLMTIEDVFQEQHQKLLEHDLMDLDVQIEVLATQLKREGVV